MHGGCIIEDWFGFLVIGPAGDLYGQDVSSIDTFTQGIQSAYVRIISMKTKHHIDIFTVPRVAIPVPRKHLLTLPFQDILPYINDPERDAVT